MSDGVEAAMTRQMRAAWIEAGLLTMNGGAASRAFDNWYASVRANALREAADARLPFSQAVSGSTDPQHVPIMLTRHVFDPNQRAWLHAEANRIEQDTHSSEPVSAHNGFDHCPSCQAEYQAKGDTP